MIYCQTCFIFAYIIINKTIRQMKFSVGQQVRVKATGQLGIVDTILNTGAYKDNELVRLKDIETYRLINNPKTDGFFLFFFQIEPIQPEPTDPYEGLDLSEDLPDSEVVNEALGLTTDRFMELLDRTKDQQTNDKPFEKPKTFEDLTPEQKEAYYMGWHEAEAKYKHEEIKVLKGWV